MKKFNLLLLLGFFVFALSPQVFAQQNQTGNQDLPASFPKYKDKGNAQADAMQYENAKKEWMRNNPDALQSSGTTALSRDEALLVVKNALNTPLPSNYKVLAYISDWGSLDKVFQVFASRYPEFYGLESDQLIQAIRKNPERYKEMINENKAIRAEHARRN